VTKGMTATALAVAHARGLLDYDTPVAAYWPEFAEIAHLILTLGDVPAWPGPTVQGYLPRCRRSAGASIVTPHPRRPNAASRRRSSS
jgi:hypothetical protein